MSINGKDFLHCIAEGAAGDDTEGWVPLGSVGQPLGLLDLRYKLQQRGIQYTLALARDNELPDVSNGDCGKQISIMIDYSDARHAFSTHHGHGISDGTIRGGRDDHAASNVQLADRELQCCR